jgi:glucose-1-phosphatase
MNLTETFLRNIIFDLGGVLIGLDISRTTAAFASLKINEPRDADEYERRAKVYSGLETGVISPGAFREAIREISAAEPSDDEIDAAWNAMLLDFPADRVETLRNLGKRYRIFLLSNSNAIHYSYYTQRFRQSYGFEMDSLFEKAYYSCELNMKKPDPEIFLKVIAESGLSAEETLFIDDSQENIRAAASLGMKVHQIVDGEDISQLFNKGILKG